MRIKAIQIISLFLLSAVGVSYAADLAPFEKTCVELGFKRKTSAYGDCVLELFERERAGRHNAALEEKKLKELEAKTRAEDAAKKAAATGDGTPDHQTCYRYGFIPETSLYAECRQKIDAAKAEARLAQTRYEADLRRYE
jgi:hypothetical protein